MVLSSAVISALAPLFIVLFVLALLLFFMWPRRFYFIRHGETLLNAEHIKQGVEGGLSEAGKQQAARIGELLAPLHIRRIISSPYERARETAVILNKRLHAPVLYSSLLVERHNPSEVVGRSTRDPGVVRIVDQVDYAYHDDTYRYSDEENFADVKHRARKCLALLARQDAHTTCVITHHAFLKMLLAYMLYGENLHAGDYTKLSFFNTSDNGGISVCDFHPWKMFGATGGWKVVTYNQQST